MLYTIEKILYTTLFCSNRNRSPAICIRISLQKGMDFCQYIVNLFIKQLPTSFLPSGAHGLFGLNTPKQLWRIRHLRPCAPLIWALLVPLGTSFLVMFCFKTFYLYKLFSGVLGTTELQPFWRKIRRNTQVQIWIVFAVMQYFISVPWKWWKIYRGQPHELL